MTSRTLRALSDPSKREYASREPDELVAELRDHLSVLGLIATSAYLLWCKRNGFEPSTSKSREDLDNELRYVHEQRQAAAGSRRHDPWRADYIRRIASGELEGQTVTSFGAQVRRLFAEVSDVEGGRDALLGLLLHVEQHADLLSGVKGFRNLDPVISGLPRLARHHRDWIRPVDEWHPTSKRPALQFAALAAHLLARYTVPPCLHACWFEPDRAEAAIQQGWYKHIGAGRNIRTADQLPFRLTKRTAHLFMSSRNGHSPPLVALRMAQIQAIRPNTKGTWYWAIAPHQRICTRDNADFWTSVIHFLLNHPMLEPNYIGALIDYVHYTKFEPRRVPQPDGTVRVEPPVHPNFSVKGRSMDKLIREVDDWHEQLSGEEYDYIDEWEPSGLKGFDFVEHNNSLNARIHWTIQELCTSALLQVEGRLMHHCVGSYAKRCISGEASIWSLRSRKHEDGAERHHVLTIAVDNGRRKVTQARGRFNLQPHDSQRRGGRQRRADSNYRVALRESARILALWRKQENLGYAQE